MNPGYPPYPQQMHQPGPYPLYPPSPAAQPAPTTLQLGFNAGPPSQVDMYPPQASSYPSQPSVYPPQTQATGYPPQPSYPSQPAPYPQPSQPSYPPAPVSPYPSAPGASYPPAPVSSYPSAPGATYPPAPMSSYPSAPGVTYPPAPVSSYPSAPGATYPPAPVSSYPSAPGATYPPAPVSSYPSAPGASYPPAPVASYSPAAGSAYPAQPSHTQSSYVTASAPSLSYSQPAKGSLYPTQPKQPAHTAYPTQGSGAIHQSFVHESHTSPSYSSHAAHYQMELRTPTVKPVSPFNPQNDAEILRKAMKGWGTDENAIINVLTKRSNQQRLEIAAAFKNMYGKDLIVDLKSELSGKFEDLIIALMKPLPEFLASELHHAMEGLGTNDSTLVEILCTASNAEINNIKAAYQKLYHGRSLENELIGDTSGNFKRLMVSLVQGRRPENYGIDEAAAIRDAQALMSAGVLRIGTDESTFNAILCSRSYPQLRRVIMEYQRISGKPLEHAIDSEFSGDIRKGLIAIIKSAEDKAGFFAERLYDAVACVGTKDRQLIRIVVSRCEIDMQSIKQAYQRLYGKSLEQDIASDTSGHYKKTLLSLVGGFY